MKMSVEQAYKILAVPRSADIKAIKNVKGASRFIKVREEYISI